MARHVAREQLPPDRTVVQFDFRDPSERYWMVLEPSEVSVCLQHPGFDVDLQITVDTATLYQVYLGRASLAGALRDRKLTMSGPRALQRGFGRWYAWSALAPASRQADQRRTAASRLRALKGCGSNGVSGRKTRHAPPRPRPDRRSERAGERRRAGAFVQDHRAGSSGRGHAARGDALPTPHRLPGRSRRRREVDQLGVRHTAGTASASRARRIATSIAARSWGSARRWARTCAGARRSWTSGRCATTGRAGRTWPCS